VPISLASRLRRVGTAKPPPGYYDPALDAAERASGRGLGDLRLDTDTANARASTGYLTTQQRAGEDYETFTGRLGQDHATQTGLLARRFRQLGQAQAGAAVSQGVAGSGGGTFAAARAARQENQGLEQSVLDTGRDRGLADALRARGRLLDDAGTDYQYGVSDRSLGLERAERENTLFGQDTAAQRAHQAAAAGYVPPKPSKPAEKKYHGKTLDEWAKTKRNGKFVHPNGSLHSKPYRGH
jgi:hypothetical protein